MRSSVKVVLVALTAGLLGLFASLALNGPGPLLRSELGQRALQGVLASTAPDLADNTRVARRGEPVEVLSLIDLEGKRVALPTAFAGRPLLINVWASWCGPCIQEMPELDRYSIQQADNGTQVVGIALDDEAAVRTFLKRVPIGYPVLLDTPGPADAGVRLGNPKGVLPYSVLISADGRLLKQRIGPFATGEIESWVGKQPGT
ncbi:MAG: redoxin family protein [Luteimonas sp.]|nr:redoxin family protein [Luteimonas sp.]